MLDSYGSRPTECTKRRQTSALVEIAIYATSRGYGWIAARIRFSDQGALFPKAAQRANQSRVPGLIRDISRELTPCNSGELAQFAGTVPTVPLLPPNPPVIVSSVKSTNGNDENTNTTEATMTNTQRNLLTTIARYADADGVASTVLVGRALGRTVAQVERIALAAESHGASVKVWVSEITGESSIRVIA